MPRFVRLSAFVAVSLPRRNRLPSRSTNCRGQETPELWTGTRGDLQGQRL